MSEIFENYYEDTYALADLEKICADAGIIEPDLNYIQSKLETFAAIYRWNLPKPTSIAPKGTVRSKELQAVRDNAQRLIASLEGLSRTTGAEIETFANYSAPEIVTTSGKEIAVPLLAIPIDTLYGDEASVGHVRVDLEAMLMLLSDLENISHEVAMKKSKSRAGRKAHSAVAISTWVSSVRSLWNEISDKPFTRHAMNDGTPLSDASLFCAEAIHRLDPAITNSRIFTAMQVEIRRRREVADRNSVQNES